jgi:hypothetical protein
MIAGLERNVEVGASGFLAGVGESGALGVGPSENRVVTAAGDPAVPDHDGSDERVGADPPRSESSQCERFRHETLVTIALARTAPHDDTPRRARKTPRSPDLIEPAIGARRRTASSNVLLLPSRLLLSAP